MLQRVVVEDVRLNIKTKVGILTIRDELILLRVVLLLNHGSINKSVLLFSRTSLQSMLQVSALQIETRLYKTTTQYEKHQE